MEIYHSPQVVTMMFLKRFKNTVKLQGKDKVINNSRQIRRKMECKALNMLMEVDLHLLFSIWIQKNKAYIKVMLIKGHISITIRYPNLQLQPIVINH